MSATMPPTGFGGTAGVAVVVPPMFALIEARDPGIPERLWNALCEDRTEDDLFDRIWSLGLRSLTDFVVAHVESDRVRFIVRGDAVAVASTPDGDRRLSADGVRTWAEHPVRGCVGFVLSLRPTPSASLPFRVLSGIVPADELMWPLASVGADDKVHMVAGQADPTGAAGDAGRTVDRVDDPVSDRAGTPERHDVLPSETVATPIEGLREGDADEYDYDYDELFGRTVMKTVGGAAVQASTDPTSPTVGEDHASVGGAGLIDGVPWAPPEQATQPGDHDGLTISIHELRSMRAGARPQAAQATPLGGPTVQALMCANGHANPPSAGTCRRCGAHLGSQPVIIGRPTLGRLSISNGEVIELDRPAILGRKPRIEGAMPAEMPHLVRIDAGQALSRSHVFVRFEGWQVFVEDLGSANGTVVTLPGRPPRRLRASETTLLEPGATIDLGGEVLVTFETDG